MLILWMLNTYYYGEAMIVEVKAMSITIKNTRKPYITPKEREQQQRQIFKKFCFELLLKQDEKTKLRSK